MLAIDTVFSRNPRISLDFLAYGVILAALYLLLRAMLARDDLRPRLGAAMVILAFALDVAYLAAVISDWITWWGVLGRIAVPPLRPFFQGLTYGNPGLAAAMAVLLSISASAHLGFAATARARAVVVVLWLLTTAVVVVSGTRGSWLALAAMAVVAVDPVRGRTRLTIATGVCPSRPRRDASRPGRRPGRRRRPRGLRADRDRSRRSTVATVDASPTGRAAPRMFTDAPITGVGPGMWAPERILHTAEGELDYYIPHAHNLVFQTAAELGLIGLVGGVVVLVLVGRLVWSSLRDGDPVVRRWAVAAILAAVYFGVHQLFDLLVNMPAALFAFAFPIAWLDANAGVSAMARWLRRRTAAGCCLATKVARDRRGRAGGRRCRGLGAGERAIGAGARRRQDRPRRRRLRPRRCGSSADAVALDPSIPPDQLLLALAAIRDGQASIARAALEAVVGADGLPPAWIDLAWLDAAAGDADGARSALAEGLRLGRQQPAIALAAGRIDELLGDPDAADGLYATALTLLPRLAADPYWQDPERAGRWAGIEAATADGLAPEDRVDLYLSAEDLDRARTAAAAVADPALAATLGRVVDAWGGDETARAALEAAAYASPRDVRLLAWSARLADRAGDHDQADLFRYLANIQSPQAGVARHRGRRS